MFRRYTERARRVIGLAIYIASQCARPEIETEHLLLGLLREDMRLAGRFLGSSFALDGVWEQIERSMPVCAMPTERSAPLSLSKASERVLAFAVDEADQFSDRHIGTGHLLLALLREEKCFAADMLHERGVRIASIREELTRIPHDDSVTEKFVRGECSRPEVAELQARIRLIRSRIRDATANQDFAKERDERNGLYLLCRRHGLSDWLYD
jgi:ATP-dependent Clp protease ATP-binding subunit ClpC